MVYKNLNLRSSIMLCVFTKLVLIALLALGVLADDISNPQPANSLTQSLQSFDFPDEAQHSKNCHLQHEK